MIKAVVIAAMIGSTVVGSIDVPRVPPSALVSEVNSALKSDRLPLPTFGSACSIDPWPYFQSHCIRDERQPNWQARPVRLVTGGHNQTALRP
jgi:hypothetical protein